MQRWMVCSGIPGVLAVAAILLLTAGSCSQESESTGPELDPQGVLALLNVMDVMAELHPDFEDMTLQPQSVSRRQAKVRRRLARARNNKSEELSAAIDALFESEPYRIYFRRFTNVTPYVMRQLILDLPYRLPSGPGGIGMMLHDLLRSRETVRGAVDRFVEQVDMGRALALAAHWAPEGSQVPSRAFLFYDSNAGSFTADGVPFFNLYGNVDLGVFAADPDDGTIEEAMAVMAHELQHTLVAPFLYPDSRPDSPWQAVWIDRITRGLVSEGVAYHCNPPQGLMKELYEDSMVVSTLVRRLNDIVIALGTEQMTEEDMQTWYQENYHDYAEWLLKGFLEHRYSGDELERQVREHAPIRPDLEHALGWWMVSRVSQEGFDREKAISLLANPYALYPQYNESVHSLGEGFLIRPEAVQILGQVAPRLP